MAVTQATEEFISIVLPVSSMSRSRHQIQVLRGRVKVESCPFVEYCRIWLRTRTNSPTRFIKVSSRSTSTRILESATPRLSPARREGVYAPPAPASGVSMRLSSTTGAATASGAGASSGEEAIYPEHRLLPILRLRRLP
jgi:hypothetical protein